MKEQRVLLALDLTRDSGQDVQRAAVMAVRAQKPWRVDSCLPRAADIRRALRGDPPVVGVVAHVSSLAIARSLKSPRIPVVNISDVLNISPFPRVCGDGYAAGRELGDYLLDKGIARVLYVGTSSHHYARRRLAGIEAALERRKPGILRVEIAKRADEAWFIEPLKRHGEAERPFAVVLEGGQMARHLYGAARHLGLSVPHDMAVVDFNADPTYCESVHPTLSSIGIASEEIGRRAACELIRRIDGESGLQDEIRIPPLGVRQRASSDTVAAGDPRLRAALAAIADSQGDITVKELLQRANMSRRPLEHLFRNHLGRSPHDMIRRARLKRAKAMLADTDLSITAIALACRFSTSSHFGSVFRRHVGCTPGDWRARARR